MFTQSTVLYCSTLSNLQHVFQDYFQLNKDYCVYACRITLIHVQSDLQSACTNTAGDQELQDQSDMLYRSTHPDCLDLSLCCPPHTDSSYPRETPAERRPPRMIALQTMWRAERWNRRPLVLPALSLLRTQSRPISQPHSQDTASLFPEAPAFDQTFSDGSFLSDGALDLKDSSRFQLFFI